MRGLLLALIVVLALAATAESAPQGGWRTKYGPHATWRDYGVPNKVSPNGLWWRGYGRMGYGWYSVYGNNYVGSNYSTIGLGGFGGFGGFGYPNRPSDPWTIGASAR